MAHLSPFDNSSLANESPIVSYINLLDSVGGDLFLNHSGSKTCEQYFVKRIAYEVCYI